MYDRGEKISLEDWKSYGMIEKCRILRGRPTASTGKFPPSMRCDSRVMRKGGVDRVKVRPFTTYVDISGFTLMDALTAITKMTEFDRRYDEDTITFHLSNDQGPHTQS